MTVAELITKLQECPQDAIALVDGYEGDQDWAGDPYTTIARYVPDAAWYYGQWKLYDDDYNRLEIGTAVVIIPRYKDPAT